jgi:hypothetical protein
LIITVEEYDGMFHLVFGDCAAKVLQIAMEYSGERKQDVVLTIKEDYSVGPVYELHTEQGLRNRIKWIKHVYHEICPEENTDWIEEIFQHNLQSLQSIPSRSTITVWHGPIACDQVGLRYVLYVLQDKNCHFYEVDLSKTFSEETPRGLGEVDPNKIGKIDGLIEPITNDKIEKWQHEWLEIARNHSMLRIVEHGKLLAVREHYFDSDILSCVSNNYQSVLDVIKNVIRNSQHPISDIFIDFRIRHLIKNNVLEYKGKLKYGEYEVMKKIG